MTAVLDDPGNVSEAPALLWEAGALAVAELVFDRALQCRATVSDAVVAEYAEAMTAGVTFPPIRVVRVGDVYLVVDGWHRAEAARKASVLIVAAEIAVGTRRDALLEAVRANATHGLQRSAEDKRRAVRVLLQDPAWYSQPSRPLGALAGVSHAFVSQVRRHYQVEVGEPLTEERIEEIDGDLPPRWAEVAGDGAYYRDEIREIRRARSHKDLASVAQKFKHYGPTIDKGVAVRLDELAVDAWPWAEDTKPGQRKARAAQLETAADLGLALQAADCPDRVRLFKIYGLIVRKAIAKAEWSGQLDEFAELVKGRPALEQAIEERRSKLTPASASSWDVAKRVLDALRQGDAGPLGEADADTVTRLVDWIREVPVAQRGALRDRAIALDPAPVCPSPLCPSGWLVDRWKSGTARCTICNRTAAETAEVLEETLRDAGRLVAGDGAVVPVVLDEARPDETRVEIDRPAAELLAALAQCSSFSPDTFAAWLNEGPPAVTAAAWRFLFCAEVGEPPLRTEPLDAGDVITGKASRVVRTVGR